MSISKRQAGFTIIELTLATAVFSVILLVITAGILSLSKSYLKGVHQSQTQETTRLVMSELSQSLEFSTDFVTGSADDWKSYCVGNVKYSYRTGVKYAGVVAGVGLGNNSSKHVLVRSPRGSDCQPITSASGFVAGKDVELLGKNMRLQKLDIIPKAGNAYTIDIQIVYGDDDLSDGSNNGGRCVGGEGSQYCAAAGLTTTVQRRL